MINWDRVAALREEVGPEDFDEVVDLFLDEADEEIATLTDHRDGRQLAEKLHFLKGSALNLGFTELSSLCQKGEAALAKDPESLFDLTAIESSYQMSRDHFLENLTARLSG